jgi:hypothetical protein
VCTCVRCIPHTCVDILLENYDLSGCSGVCGFARCVGECVHVAWFRCGEKKTTIDTAHTTAPATVALVLGFFTHNNILEEATCTYTLSLEEGIYTY